MGLFSNIKNAKPVADVSFMGRGRYWLRIDRTFSSENRQHIPYAAIDGTVIAILESHEIPIHRIGEEIRRHISAGDYFDSEIQAFLLGTGVITDADLAADKAGKGNNMEEGAELIFPYRNPETRMGRDGKPFPPSLQQGWVIELDNKEIQIQDKEKDPQKTLGITKPFTKIKFVREVPPQEVLKGLPAELVERFFPGQVLQKRIAQSQIK